MASVRLSHPQFNQDDALHIRVFGNQGGERQGRTSHSLDEIETPHMHTAGVQRGVQNGVDKNWAGPKRNTSIPHFIEDEDSQDGMFGMHGQVRQGHERNWAGSSREVAVPEFGPQELIREINCELSSHTLCCAAHVLRLSAERILRGTDDGHYVSCSYLWIASFTSFRQQESP